MPHFTPISSFHLKVMAMYDFFRKLKIISFCQFCPQFVPLQVVLMDLFCRIAVSDASLADFCTTSQYSQLAPDDYLVQSCHSQLTL